MQTAVNNVDFTYAGTLAIVRLRDLIAHYTHTRRESTRSHTIHTRSHTIHTPRLVRHISPSLKVSSLFFISRYHNLSLGNRNTLVSIIVDIRSEIIGTSLNKSAMDQESIPLYPRFLIMCWHASSHSCSPATDIGDLKTIRHRNIFDHSTCHSLY